MNQQRQLILLCLTAAVLSGCSTATRRAPVVDRAAPVESSKSAPEAKVDAHGMYTVKKNDTLIKIALDHGQNYRDLVAWNNLPNPNDIKVDQVLRVLPPEHPAGVQTSAISMPPSTERAAPPAPPKKTTPRGDKKAYSEANVAELQKPDSAKADAKVDAKPDARTDAKPADKPELAATPAVAVPSVPVSVPPPSLPVPSVSPDDEKLSWMWPSDGKVIATFDEGKNKGIDISGKAGQQVMAAGSGKVMYAGSGIRGYGNLVIVKHNNNLLSAYAHNRNILVKEGQNVNKGQMIAEMGDSDADTVKLHFEIRQQGKPVDPSKFLPTR